MKRLAIVFVLAVLVPCLVLGSLALRSLNEQEYIVEKQRALLHQDEVDYVVDEINLYLGEVRRKLEVSVERMLEESEPIEIAQIFDEQITQSLPVADVGFMTTMGGRLCSPISNKAPDKRIVDFLSANGSFLSNREEALVYYDDPVLNASELQRQQRGYATKYVPPSAKTRAANQQIEPTPDQQAIQAKVNRIYGKTMPQNPWGFNNNNIAGVSDQTEFRSLVQNNHDGTVARFLHDRLSVLIWYRPQSQPDWIFGVQLDMKALRKVLGNIVESASNINKPSSLSSEPHICLVLLDDKSKPVGKTLKNFVAEDWEKPFLANTIGGILPHWEVGAYLADPNSVSVAAQTRWIATALLVLVLFAVIAAGSMIIFWSMQNEIRLARQKTDFVSNVSHELKTPLTSIRMFSDLLSSKSGLDESKRQRYAGVIASESARLTRLINNVLDFSRMDRGEKQYEFSEVDVVAIINETAEQYRPHIESLGQQFDVRCTCDCAVVSADRDAISQVLLNLLSNSEKYASCGGEIEVEVSCDKEHVEVSVLDRGPGIPKALERKVFEKFCRGDDSLCSGISGSGLGLTLAKQIAEAHDGVLEYESRKGGGSCFTMRLPIT